MKNSWWKTALLYGIGGAVLAWVIWSSRDGLANALSKPVRFWPYAAAGVFCCLSVGQTIVRWFLLVRAQDLPFTLKNAFRLGLIGYYFNTVAPGSVGGDLFKAVGIAREQERRSVAVATIMVDRAIGLWALIALVALLGGSFWAFDPDIMQQPDLRRIVLTAFGLLAASLLFWAFLGVLPDRRVQRFAQRLQSLPKIGGPLSEAWRAVVLYRRKAGMVLIALAMSLVGHTCSVLMFYFVVLAFQPEGEPAKMPGLREHFLIVPVGMIVGALPLLPGGLGVGEAIYGKLYSLLGFPTEIGVLGSLGQRILTWILGAVGFVVYTFMKRELPKDSPESSPTLLTPH